MSATTGFTSRLKTTPSVSDGVIENILVAAANIEQSHVLPIDSVMFVMRTRAPAVLKLSYTSGMSGTSYLTILPGVVYSSPEFRPSSKTLYFQSPTAGITVEVESWS